MSQPRASNQRYIGQLAASLTADPAVGPAAITVLRSFWVGLPGSCYTPRVRNDPAEPNRWTGTRVDDALAALAVLEARQILTPPSSPHHHGVWQPGSHSAFEHVERFTTGQWTALLERYWTLLNTYQPSYGRTVHFSDRMVTQLLALCGETATDDACARATLAQWADARDLQQQRLVDGTVAYRDPQTHVGVSDGVTAACARRMREHLSREHDTIFVTPDGAFVRGHGPTMRALHLSALNVRDALAYDASRAYGHGEALVAKRSSDGTGIVTLDILLDMRVCPHIVDTLRSLAHRLCEEPQAARIQAITNTSVRLAAADEFQHLAETLMALVDRCRRHARHGTRRLAAAQTSVTRLMVAARRVQSKQPDATYGVRNTGVRWSKALDAVRTLPGIPRGLSRDDLLDVVPASAWAYPKVSPTLHPLYRLLAPAGVRPSAAVLAAHRYHKCAATRADARIALELSGRVSALLNASHDIGVR